MSVDNVMSCYTIWLVMILLTISIFFRIIINILIRWLISRNMKSDQNKDVIRMLQVRRNHFSQMIGKASNYHYRFLPQYPNKIYWKQPLKFRQLWIMKNDFKCLTKIRKMIQILRTYVEWREKRQTSWHCIIDSHTFRYQI